MEAWLNNIASQGTLGTLLVLSIMWASWATRGWMSEKDKRAQDGKEYMAATLGPVRDLTNAVMSMQKQLESNSTVLQNIGNK